MMPRVRCAICDKPVDGLEVFWKAEGLKRELVVWCHGERDSMVLRMDRVSPDDLRQMAAQEGIAFDATTPFRIEQ